MDSTPNPSLSSFTSQPHHPLSIKTASSSASKLPIKRKTPDSTSSPYHSSPDFCPNPSISPILVPKIKPAPASTTDDGENDDDDDGENDNDLGAGNGDRNPPPFKFHRIWTEPDEIRFLQGLLDCSSEDLSFPRDLNVFYARFSDTMSQPYTKPQLSEKLRRLRKKFRVISSRLARGLDRALLSLHDRALFDLSKQLWHPEFSSTSPFGAGNNKQKKSNLVGIKVSFSPTLPPHSILVSNQAVILESKDHTVLNSVIVDDQENNHDDHVDVESCDFDVKFSEGNVDFGCGSGKKELPMSSGSAGVLRHNTDGGLGKVVAKAAINVFDQSLKEFRMALVGQNLQEEAGTLQEEAGTSQEGKVDHFEKRWREQRFAELDVLAGRLRLVLEHSLRRQ